MDNNAIEAYFKQLATRYTPIGHTEENPKFARFDIEEVFSGLRTTLDMTEWCLLLESPTGSLEDNGGSQFYDNQAVAFLICRQVATNDFDAERDTLNASRDHCHQLVAKLLQDYPRHTTELVNSTEYEKVGPVFNNAYGYRFAFRWPDELSLQVDPDRWSNA